MGPEVQISGAEKRRAAGWQPGVSGNPGGRPKAVKAVIELARKHTTKAIKALEEALEDEDARVRVSAAQALLDRGWGKAPQVITGANGEPLTLSIHIDISGGKDAE